MVTCVAADRRAKPGQYGEAKKRWNLMLTQSSVDKADELADELGVTRSEVFELLSRSDCFEAEILRKVKAGLEGDRDAD